MTLPDLVRRAVERDALLPAGTRVLAAVSGGADSVAMLHALVALAPVLGFTVAGVVHINHSLRGDESDGDETFCRGLAGRLGLPFDTERVDVATLAMTEQISIETAARRARYRVFHDASLRLGADRVATAHTRDDQAETVLLRLLRGAGTAGLGGIHPRRGGTVRPMLDIRRADILAFLEEIGEDYREDSSNRDESIPRNWIRHQLLPFIADRLNGDVVEALARAAIVLRDEEELLDQLAEQASVSARLEPGAPGTMAASQAGDPGTRAASQAGDPGPARRATFDPTRLSEMPPALARRVVRAALLRVNNNRFVGFEHVERVLAFARFRHRAKALCHGSNEPAGPTAQTGSSAPAGSSVPAWPGSEADLPGARLEPNGGNVVLSNRASRSGPAPEAINYRYRLDVPGRLELPECGAAIDASIASVPDPQDDANAWVTSPREAVIDAAFAGGGLWVRSRVPGDALRPFGMSGRKKVQDLLVDRKVPRAERDRVPIVVDDRDRVLWVAGHAAADDARITERTQTVVILKLRRHGEL